MKKNICKFFAAASALFLLASCENFLDGNELKSSINEKINLEKSEVVILRFQSTQAGTMYPSSDKEYHVGEKQTVEFTYDPGSYSFEGFIVVNKDDSKQIQWNDGIPAIEIVDSKEEILGVYKKVSATVKINGSIKNAQISPSVSILNDNTPPLLTSDFEVTSPFSGEAFPSHAAWGSEDYDKYHVKNSVHVKFTAAEYGSGKIRLKVVEKPVKKTDGTAASQIAFTNFDDAIALQSGPSFFEADGEYKIHTVYDGVVMLQFSLTDMVNNETEVLKTVYVLTDNTVADSLKDYLNIILPTSEYLSCDTEEKLLETASRVFVEKLLPAEASFYTEKIEELSFEYYASTNMMDWKKVDIEKETDGERYFINIGGIDRSNGIFIKVLAGDRVGNIKEEIFTLNKPGKIVYVPSNDSNLMIPVVNDATGGYILIWHEENEQELHFLLSGLDTNCPENIPGKKYFGYLLCADRDNGPGLLSEKIEITSDFVVPAESDWNLDVNYSLESKGVNTGLYTLKLKVENFEELNSTYFIAVESYSKYSDRSDNGEIVFDNISYDELTAGKINFVCITWGEGKGNFGTVGVDASAYPDFVPNVSPEITSAVTSYGELLSFTATDAEIMSGSKLYYSDKIIERTEEEIQQLDVMDVYDTMSAGKTAFYDINALAPGNYVFYFYASDSYGNYTYKKTTLNKTAKEEYISFGKILSDYKLARPMSLSGYSLLCEGYYTSGSSAIVSYLTGITSKSFSNIFGYYKYAYYKTADDGTLEIVCGKPVCKYGSSTPVLVKRVSEAAGIVTVTSDMPCLVETIATDDDYTNWTIDDWLMRTPYDNKRNLKKIGADGGTSHVVSYSNYTIEPLFDFKAYCVIVHFADGTAQICKVFEN